MAVVLDSGAVVAFLDRDDALHASADAAIRKLIVGHRFYASVVTFAEVLTGVRLGKYDEQLIRGFFDDLVELVPVENAIADRAARLRASRKSLSITETMVLATADLHPDEDVVLLTGNEGFEAVRGLDCRVSLLR